MRNLRAILVIGLLCFLLPVKNTSAQAEVVFGNTITFYDEDRNPFPSIESKSIITPTGNILKTAVFQLPEGHNLIPEKGKNYIPAGLSVIDNNEEKQLLINYNVKVGKDGKFTIVLHLNSSGSIFPRGW